MKKVKTLSIIAGSLLAAAVWLTPASSSADNTIPQLIIDICRDVAANPGPAGAHPSCFGKCVSFYHVCYDEQTGEFDPTPACEKKLDKANEACGF